MSIFSRLNKDYLDSINDLSKTAFGSNPNSSDFIDTVNIEEIK